MGAITFNGLPSVPCPNFFKARQTCNDYFTLNRNEKVKSALKVASYILSVGIFPLLACLFILITNDILLGKYDRLEAISKQSADSACKVASFIHLYHFQASTVYLLLANVGETLLKNLDSFHKQIAMYPQATRYALAEALFKNYCSAGCMLYSISHFNLTENERKEIANLLVNSYLSYRQAVNNQEVATKQLNHVVRAIDQYFQFVTDREKAQILLPLFNMPNRSVVELQCLNSLRDTLKLVRRNDATRQ